MSAQLVQVRQHVRESVDQRRDKAENSVHLSREEAVETLAKEEGWSIIVRKGLHSAIWAGGAPDKTE